MIITLKGADFSASNIGTLSSWRITRSLGAGATYEGVASVDKGAAFSATVTLAEGYEIGAAGVTVTMGGTVLSGAHSVSGNVITITIASVTGNVLIKVPTVNTAGGDEPDIPVEPDEPESILPAGYQAVEYFDTDGTQTFIFDLKPNQNLNFEMKFKDLTADTNTYAIFGQYGSSPNRGLIRMKSGTQVEYMYGDNGADAFTTVNSFRTSARVLKTVGNKLYVDGSLKKTYAENTFEATRGAYLFGQYNNAESASRVPSARCYYVNIQQDAVNMRLVPCYRVSDGKIGLYDINGNQFHAPAFGVISTKGSDITITE